jgi:hypothetical protein
MTIAVMGPTGKKTSIARFIRDHLTKVGEASIYDIYTEYKKDSETRGYKPVRYSSVRVIVYVLRKVGVIKDVKEESPMHKWTMHDKKFIKIVKGMENHLVWDDVWAYYDAEITHKGIPSTGGEEGDESDNDETELTPSEK